MKKSLKLLSLLVMLSMVLSLCTVFGGLITFGATTIEIDTADKLRLIGRDAAYPLDGNYVLTADIDLADKEWVPISSDNEAGFAGSFDGNGHVISNLFIGTADTAKVITDSSPYGYGLFSYLAANASVSNLLFKDICININASGRTNLAVGAVAGYTKYSGWKISNVVVLSGLIAASNQRQNRVGGILGCCHSSTDGAAIENCYNGATIVSSFTNTSGNCYAGAAGIVGFTNGKNLSVKNCLNVGEISTPVSGLGKNRGSIGNIVAFPSTSATIKTELAEGSAVLNSFSLEGLLDYDTTSTFTAHFNADKTSVSLVSAENAKLAASFKALTDVENGTVWVCADGKYPMLKMFESYAISVPQGTPDPTPDPNPNPDPDPNAAIEIRTEEELRKIGVETAYPLDGNYILMADIDMTNSADWSGIGGSTGFSGTFDGNGHIITGMHAGTKETPYALEIHAWGLFPILLEGATVKNLMFKDVFFNGSWTDSNTAVGTVCGYTKQNNVTIENVVVLSGSLQGSCTRQTRVGGILGVTRAEEGTLIKNCYNGADVYGTYTGTNAKSYLSLGGIVGRYEGTKEQNGVVNCFNVGKIVALNTSGTSNYSAVGAIVALSNTASAAAPDTAYAVNCYTVEDLLGYDTTVPERISRYASDANTAKVKDVAVNVSGASLSYTGLVNGSNGAWTAKDGYYPMPTLFKDHAVSAPFDPSITPDPDPNPNPNPDPQPDPTKPIEINNEEELRKIGVDAAYPLDGNYILMADIDMTNSADWSGIGGETGFSGTFDGNGHIITGMHAGTKATPYALGIHAWGLFPILLEGATVKNLMFKDVFFNGTYSGNNTAVGTVCGYTKQENIAIENIVVLSGYLQGSSLRQTRVGGILGVTRAGDGTLIKNCYNGAEIRGTYTSTKTNCYLSLGGIVGRYEGTKELNGIINCFNAGKVVALKTSGTTNYSAVGAIVALSNTASAAAPDTAYAVNCYTVKDVLSYDATAPERITRYASDANRDKVKEIAPVVSGTALAYSGLVSASDGAWVAKDGFYPILTMFKDYAVAVSVDTDVESYLEGVLKELYVYNTLTEAEVSVIVKEALGDSFTVNSCTLNLTKATASAAGTYKISVAFTDGAKNYSVVVDGTFALPSIDYSFATEIPGRADGTVTVTDAAYKATNVYALYWGDSKGPLAGYSCITEGFTVNGNVLTYKFADLVVIPEKATHLWVTVSEIPVNAYEIPASRALKLGKLIYNYGMLSDIHFGDKNVPEYFTAAMNLFSSVSSVFTATTGDFTDGGSAADWKLFTDTYTAGGWKQPVWTALGNHDILKWNIDDAISPKDAMANIKAAVETYVNKNYVADAQGNRYKVTLSEKHPDYDYTVEYGDDLFIYMGIGAFRNDSAKNVDQHLAKDQLTWLDGVLSDHYENADVYGHVYLVFHYYTMESGFGMYQNGSTSGTEWSRNMNGFMTDGYNSSEELFKILTKYPNVIHFSGHTHRNFSKNNNLSITRNYVRLNDNGGYEKCNDPLGYVAVHVPALSVSKEGYLVSVYENGILLTGYNFVEDVVVPNATFFIANDEGKTQMRVNATSGMVQLVQGYGEWKNLIASSAMKDENGKAFELKVGETHIQWKYTDASEWKDLIALTALTDANGKSVELQVSGGYVQSRYESGTWTNLASFDALKNDTQVPPTSDLAIHGLIVLAMTSLAVGAVVVLKKRHA